MSFATAVQVLSDAGVEFIIIGGWSAVLHGRRHATNDLDIFYSRRTENLTRMTRALSPYHPRPRDFPAEPPFPFDEVTVSNSAILLLTTDLGYIDLHAEVAGLGPFEQVAADAVKVEIFGRTVLTLDLESLIKSKKAAGREKDLRVIPELESLREAEEL